ncbi:Uncharacterised protein [Legionella pneumophila]|nr:Uncharacterised protein [Legionella pneumophila]
MKFPANKTLQNEIGLRPLTKCSFPRVISFAMTGLAALIMSELRNKYSIPLCRNSILIFPLYPYQGFNFVHSILPVSKSFFR